MVASEVVKILEDHGVQSTALRCKVLDIILSHNAPIKAYDLVLKMNVADTDIKPMTIYRILNLFLTKGLLHKIASKSLFVLCKEHRTMHHGDAVFLVCQKCSEVQEVCDKELNKLLDNVYRRYDFSMIKHNTEIAGYCSKCREGL